MKKSIEKRLLTVHEAAEYLSLAPRTLYNQIGPNARKRFPVKPIRWGGKVLFDRSELDSYVDSLLEARDAQ